MEVGERTIGLIIEAELEGEALAAADIALADEISHLYGLYDECRIQTDGVLRMDTPEARRTLQGLWSKQQAVYGMDMSYIARLLQEHPGGSSYDLLNQVAFRAACFRLGTQGGFPVRAYGLQREGLIWEQNYQWFSQGCPDDLGVPAYSLAELWLVLVEMG